MLLNWRKCAQVYTVSAWQQQSSALAAAAGKSPLKRAELRVGVGWQPLRTRSPLGWHAAATEEVCDIRVKQTEISRPWSTEEERGRGDGNVELRSSFECGNSTNAQRGSFYSLDTHLRSGLHFTAWTHLNDVFIFLSSHSNVSLGAGDVPKISHCNLFAGLALQWMGGKSRLLLGIEA